MLLIVCSGPVSDWLHTWYRYHVTELVEFLDTHHPNNWHMWNFRGEGSGYSDSQVRDQVSHYPFPDHQIPPLTVISECTTEIDQWLRKSPDTVAVLHCKAGKGRSGTLCCAYLLMGDPAVSGLQLPSTNLTVDNVVAEYTAKRMRKQCGSGISIKSQLRYLRYWNKYLMDPPEQPLTTSVKITRIVLHDMAPLVKVQIQSYVETKGTYCIHNNSTFTMGKEVRELEIDQVMDTPDIRILIDDYASFWFNVNFEQLGTAFEWTQFDGFKGTGYKGVASFHEMILYWQ
ncbi:Telomerase protein component 1 [Scheffersomyces spartinae]|uniref:phosphatidylinositol-3,4,5-trisphosphate 3-phosphatase n=1 Tax=Scheffersomyces spartinae TaxID=45513 RepID=A0A9P7V5J8_9ASCO|nr:Telomerase protein component 1 [Scheffersomyces spartinae]KAG7191781.1 Telomerase protein component 1 [Scheffersomyces spartinae]